jgi:prolyl 4-hydroxylase
MTSSLTNILLTLLLTLTNTQVHAVDYGKDVSWPMTTYQINSTENTNILHARQEVYEEYMKGCREKYHPDYLCNSSEDGRIDMSADQPRSMQNYTDLGFKKIKTPPRVWKLIKDFWERNNPVDTIHKQKPENWNSGNSYVNHWVSPTYMLSVEDTGLRGGGYKIKDAIWGAAKSTLEEWTGEDLQPCSLYGIRIYTEGAILATHVDRLPLVSSAIVNVAQDVEEPWPIEVIGHDGRAHNITMEPGDMVLYESHSVLHGRPFALKGKYYANIFIHFEPTGHSLRHADKVAAENDEYSDDVAKKYKKSIEKGHGGHENSANDLPSYIKKGSAAADKWLAENHNTEPAVAEFTEGSTEAHLAVQEGKTKTLLKIISKKEELVHAKDQNGWTPLHEAARTGSIDAIELLVMNGADVNAKTVAGETVLYLAQSTHGVDHPTINLLTEMGAIFEGPEL